MPEYSHDAASTTGAPRPASSARVSTAIDPFGSSSSDSIGQWTDRDDVADRQAADLARRAELSERPPHY